MTNEIIDMAIGHIKGMIDSNIDDMAKGGVYVRNESRLCLDLITLVEKLEKRKTPVKKVKK